MNAKASGKAALHCATVAGDLAVIKAILDFNPDLEIEVCPDTIFTHNMPINQLSISIL